MRERDSAGILAVVCLILMRKNNMDTKKELREECLSVESLEVDCSYSHIPNEETIKAIKRAQNKKNLVRVKDMDEFRKKLGL